MPPGTSTVGVSTVSGASVTVTSIDTVFMSIGISTSPSSLETGTYTVILPPSGMATTPSLIRSPRPASSLLLTCSFTVVPMFVLAVTSMGRELRKLILVVPTCVVVYTVSMLTTVGFAVLNSAVFTYSEPSSRHCTSAASALSSSPDFTVTVVPLLLPKCRPASASSSIQMRAT